MSEQPVINPSSDKLWNVLCHLSVFLGVGLILPLIVFLVTRSDTGSSIPKHARETLNFHISLLIYAIVGGLLTLVLIGFAVLFLVAVATVILSIVGAVKASNGEVYHYPLTLRLVR